MRVNLQYQRGYLVTTRKARASRAVLRFDAAIQHDNAREVAEHVAVLVARPACTTRAVAVDARVFFWASETAARCAWRDDGRAVRGVGQYEVTEFLRKEILRKNEKIASLEQILEQRELLVEQEKAAFIKHAETKVNGARPRGHGERAVDVAANQRNVQAWPGCAWPSRSLLVLLVAAYCSAWWSSWLVPELLGSSTSTSVIEV